MFSFFIPQHYKHNTISRTCTTTSDSDCDLQLLYSWYGRHIDDEYYNNCSIYISIYWINNINILEKTIYNNRLLKHSITYMKEE